MANYIPDELIAEITAANDIVEVASSYMKLKRSGNGYKGLCPFHGEKTPSFHISPDKQLYHCFGCGAGGSVLQFIMNIENLDFVDGVKMLAARANIPIPEGDSPEVSDKTHRRKQAIYKINSLAAKFYHANLMKSDNMVIQNYLIERGLDANTVVRFGIGYAPNDYDTLTKYLLEEGFSEQEILDSGIARKSEKNGNLYDFFRNRVIFPIIDVRGNVVGFGGRVTDKSLPKYLNSSDSPVFSKSKTLFALNFAKNHCRDRIILCEGYMDVIALHKAGFEYAVATLGTALTKEHCGIISRYTKEVLLCYDSDEAGQKATAAAIALLKDVNVRTKVLVMKGAKDPDDYIKLKGAAAFEQLIIGSENAVLYKINKLKQQYNTDVLEEKLELINKAVEVFAEIESPVELELTVKDFAAQMDVNPETVFAQIRQYRLSKGKKQGFRQTKVPKPEIDKEGMLLGLMAANKSVYLKMKKLVNEDFFEKDSCKAFYNKLVQLKEKGFEADSAAVLASLDDQHAKSLSGMLTAEMPYENPEKAAEDIYVAIKNSKTNINKIKSPEELSRIIDLIKQQKKTGRRINTDGVE
ncbi:MAG: DNA primase [Monoglobales bacterium]